MEKINNWLDSVYSDGSCNFVSNPLPKKGETISSAELLPIYLRLPQAERELKSKEQTK